MHLDTIPQELHEPVSRWFDGVPANVADLPDAMQLRLASLVA